MVSSCGTHLVAATPEGGAAGFRADAPFRGFDFSRNGVPVSTGAPEVGLASLRLPALSPRRLHPNTHESSGRKKPSLQPPGSVVMGGLPQLHPPPPGWCPSFCQAVQAAELFPENCLAGGSLLGAPGSVGLQPPSPLYAVPGAIVGGGGASGPLFPAAKMLSPCGARGRSTTLTEPRALAPASGNRQACSPGTGFTASSGLTRAPQSPAA